MKTMTLDYRWAGRYANPDHYRHPSIQSGLYRVDNGMCCLGIACVDVFDLTTKTIKHATMPFGVSFRTEEFKKFVQDLEQGIGRPQYKELVGETVTRTVISESEDPTLPLGIFIARVNDSPELNPNQKARAIRILFKHFLDIDVTFKRSDVIDEEATQ